MCQKITALQKNKQKKIISFWLWISSVNVTKSGKIVELVTFTEKIPNGKLDFCAVLAKNAITWRYNVLYGTTYSRMGQMKFVEDSF